jgi:hypothetical protein
LQKKAERRTMQLPSCMGLTARKPPVDRWRLFYFNASGLRQ